MKMGIGVVGAGVNGCHSLERNLLSANPDARLIAVSAADWMGAHHFEDTAREGGQRLAAELGGVFLDDWHEVVSHPDVDIVSAMICPLRKPEVIIAALEAGKHVVTDKPLGMRAEDARTILAAEGAGNARGFMLAGYHVRPPVMALMEAIRAGRLGALKAIEMRLCFMGGIYPGFHPTKQWRSEIPSAEMTTIGSHALVTVMKLAGETPSRVRAIQRNMFYDEYRAVGAEDWAEFSLEFPSGLIASLTTARLPYRVPGEDFLLQATGTDGYAEIRQNRVTFYPGEDSITPPAYELDDPFRAFYKALENGEAMPTSLKDGLDLQRVLDAAIESAASGQTVTVAPER